MTEKHDEYPDEDFEKSKSAVKRDMQALHDLGVKLTELTPAQQAKIPMSDTLRSSIEEAPHITQNSGRKRHLKFIGKLMRKEDGDAIQTAYENLMDGQHQNVRQHHQMEQWRDLLLKDNNALPEFIQQFPECDRQQLRQLIRASQKETSLNKPPASARKLFKFIRECFD
ncbi:ribosome biogenesis factor YjgA [Teredinibacter purpureus]|uniref:ribosome biogenesis factor YjgA n=1 Tax=Teredinibacter purpureus TaxID=2731756 RepID=UPI0005F83412|nr:ribosome biogenesis factor YjgA [Teredinibacter purpureus]